MAARILLYKPQPWKTYLIFAAILAAGTIYLIIAGWAMSAIVIVAIIAAVFFIPFLIGRRVRRVGINLDTRMIYFDTRRLFAGKVYELLLKDVSIHIIETKHPKGNITYELKMHHLGKEILSISPGMSGWSLKTLREIEKKAAEVKGM